MKTMAMTLPTPTAARATAGAPAFSRWRRAIVQGVRQNLLPWLAIKAVLTALVFGGQVGVWTAFVLDTAVLVNPHDIDGMAQKISMALHMPVEERRERWSAGQRPGVQPKATATPHPAIFIFSTEDGTISAWNPAVDPNTAKLMVDNSGAGAVYKGLAIALGAAVWSSGVLPRWSGVPIALGFALYIPQFFGNQPIRVAHGLVVAAGCLWLATGIWRSPG